MIKNLPIPWTRLIVLLLFPCFFFLHSINEYNMGLPGADVWLLLLVYIVAALLCCTLLRLLLEDWNKAIIATTVLLAINFFFGNLQDALKPYKESFFTRYSFLLPLLLVLFIAIVLYMKKSSKDFKRTVSFFKLLFVVLLLVDGGQLLYKEWRRSTAIPEVQRSLQPCTNCPKPDIYLVIADEYAGTDQLEKQLSFDNSAFEAALEERGFRVLQQTRSNYNFTMYSMASLLNLDYLHQMNGRHFSHNEVFLCRRLIANSMFGRFLDKLGYETLNHSFFDLEDHPKAVYNYYFLEAAAYINRQTLAGRMNYDLGFHLASAAKKEKIRMNDHYNNVRSSELTIQAVGNAQPTPKFVYTHLSLPHHPYYFDRNGNPVATEGLDQKASVKAYTEYLLYANKRFLTLVDSIQKNAAGPPVIILLGDHGFRKFTDPASRAFHFSTLNAVYLPSGKYDQFYDGMSNVNELRALLNSLFQQRLPMLKDSTIFLQE